jgi:sugar lactone lactonase YvrE
MILNQARCAALVLRSAVCRRKLLLGFTAALLLVLGHHTRLQAAVFISDFQYDTVGSYDEQTGATINAGLYSATQPTSLAVGTDGSVYVSGGAVVPGFYPGVVRFDGTTGVSQGTVASTLTDPLLQNPGGVAVAPDGTVYVGDYSRNSILVYDALGNHVNELSSVLLNAPAGLAYDSFSGALFVADENNGDLLKYSGGSFSVVNNIPSRFNAAHAVTVGTGGFAYVLDRSGTGGIYKVDINSGSYSKIIDYEHSAFYASGLAFGPDGHLYVSGSDTATGEGEVLRYATDGSGGGVFIDVGLLKLGQDSSIAFSPVPEPTACILFTGLGLLVFAFGRRRFVSRRS